MKFGWKRRLVVPAVLVTWVSLGTAWEQRRLHATVPAKGTTPPQLDGEGLLADMRILSEAAMEGRATGTPGGLRARDWVAGRFAEIGLDPLPPGYLQPFGFEHTSIRALWRRDRPFRKAFQGANVIGSVPGRDPSAGWLLVSAHYDHLGMRGGTLHPGADDNASGVATLLALATYVRAHPLRHGVLFAAFDGEELGLRGARAFVKAPPIPLGVIRAVLNMDMLSRSATNDVSIAGTNPWPALRPPVERAASRSGLRVHLGHDQPQWRSGAVEDWTSSSDHGPFAEAGLPWLYVGVEDHEDYHRPTDTFDRIDRAFLLRVAELVREILAEIDAR